MAQLDVVPELEVVAAPDDQLFVRTRKGSLLVHGIDAATLRSLLEGIASGKDVAKLADTMNVSPPDLHALIESLIDAGALQRTNTEKRATRIVTIFNGTLGLGLHTRLAKTLGGNASFFELGEFDSSTAEFTVWPQSPNHPIANSAPLKSNFERAVKDQDLIVCALENVSYTTLIELNRQMLAGRGKCLFVSAEAGQFILGPTVQPGKVGCLECVRSSHLLDWEPEDIECGFPLEVLKRLSIGTANSIDEFTLSLGIELTARTALWEAEGCALEDQKRVDEIAVPAADFVTIAAKRRGNHPCPACDRRIEKSAVSGPVSWSTLNPSGEVVVQTGVMLSQVFEEVRRRGAGAAGHQITTFFEHLFHTHQILTAWGLPVDVTLAGLLHSGYGTDAFRSAMFSFDERAAMRALIGSAEDLVFLFCTIDRGHFLSIAEKLEELKSGVGVRNRFSGEEIRLPSTIAAKLLCIEAANLAEQTHGDEMSPGIWLAWCTHALRLASELETPKNFREASIGREIERTARREYMDGLALLRHNPEGASELFQSAARHNALVAEPLVHLAECSVGLGRFDVANIALKDARKRYLALGTSWDKRCSLEVGLATIDQLDHQVVIGQRNRLLT